MKTHFGQGRAAACNESGLTVKTCTMDIQAVDCTACLFVILAHAFDSSQKIAERIRVVTSSERNDLADVVLAGRE